MEAGLLVDQPLPRELHHLFRHARLVEFDVTLEQFQPVLLVTGLEPSHANRCFARALHVSILPSTLSIDGPRAGLFSVELSPTVKPDKRAAAIVRH